MAITFKKILFLLFFAIFLACESDDGNADSNTINNNNQPINNAPIIDDEGNINISELRRVNPNFNLENLMQLGASASDLARGNQFRSITLEVVSVEGFEPSEFAKQNLIQFIEDRLNKPDGVRIVEQTIPPLDVESFDVSSIFGSVEAVHRTQFNTEDDLAIFIFFADQDDVQSNFDGRSGTIILGTAYLNTSFVVYESTLRRLTQNVPNALERVQAGTLNHEFCHLLGLVNSEFTPEQQPHEDLAEDDNGELVGNNHCNVPFCLMEATARLSRDMMNNVNVLQLDPLCIEDLRAIGGR